MIKYIVGIDFGTTFSGFAWATVDNPKDIRGPDHWENQSISIPYRKTPTSIRYNLKDLSIDSWGYKSRSCVTKIKSGELVEVKMFKLFFDPSVERILPTGMHWMKPSVDFLACMRIKIISTIEKTFLKVDDAEISWCITVPAFWSEGSKSLVREACAHAGIGAPPLSHHLSIILEPEAAALYCMRKVQDINLKHGDSFMICDAGGGTVDLTMHVFIQKNPHNPNPAEDTIDFELFEKTRGTGDFCGSISVDKAFIDLFAQEISVQRFATLLKERPDLVETFKTDWEGAKRSFGRNDGKENELIAFPNGILRFIDNDTKQRWGNQFGTEDEFLLTHEQMVQCFSGAVTGVCKLIDGQLSRLEPGDSCDTLILVGGFSASPYLESVIKQKFGSRFKRIIVPLDPASAILQGAVHYGLYPSAIPVRRARMSFGLISYVKPQMLVSYHPSDIGINRNDGQKYVRVFKCIVQENQPIEESAIFETEASPYTANQNTIVLELLATPMPITELYTSLSFVGELHLLARIKVDVTAPPGLKNTAQVQLAFGKTEIECTIVSPYTGVGQKVSLDYSFQLPQTAAQVL